MSENAETVCQQCNEVYGSNDTKPTYDEEGEICGHVCNPCRLKSVECARRCHIVDCKTRPDSGPTGFRTLPSKFYDLPEGEVKKRIIKQFGIIKNAKACCNMCYVRISKAIVQINIVYGDGLLRQNKFSWQNRAGKQHLPSSTQNASDTKAPQAKESRLAEYTGPKFTRRSGGYPCWNKNRIVAANPANENRHGLQRDGGIVNSTTLEQRAEIDNNSKVKSEDNNSEVVNDNKTGPGVINSSSFAKDILVQNHTEIGKIKQEVDNSQIQIDGNVGQKAVTYSSTPISPTSMRFRRIQPKLPKFEEFDLSDGMVDMEDNTSPVKRSRQMSSDHEDDDFTWSPGGLRKEKVDEKFKKQKKAVSSEVMSDFVSCIGCRKICSSKEAKPVYDFDKFCGRLCNECRIKKREDNKNCPIKGCTTPLNDAVLKPLPPNIQEATGEAKKQLTEMGVTEKTKLCCKPCWKLISNFLTNGNEELQKSDSNNEQVFTMCRNCCTIVPINDTVPNYEEDGRQCGVLCKLCFGMQPTGSQNDKKELKFNKKSGRSDLGSPTPKSTGICKVKGCVNAGQKEPIQLVSGKKILQNYLDEKMLRTEFSLDDETDYCCRSCLARIKWFVADIRKKECGVGSDGKPINSLKNLTSRIGIESNDKPKNTHTNSQVKAASGKTKSPATSAQNQQQYVSSNHSPVTNTVSRLPLKSPQYPYHQSGMKNQRRPSHSEAVQDPNAILVPSSTLSSISPAAFVIPPASPTQTNPQSSHPPVLQVGGQQFVLNVISRCDKEIQTADLNELKEKQKPVTIVDKGVQANIPLMPKFEGTVPANLPNGKKVKYSEAKDKTKYAVKRQGKDLFEQFLEQLNDISGGCAQQLLLDIYRPKEVSMATNYEKILTSIGSLYRNTDRSNKQERLRLLSTVALHAPNETLKRFFQRRSKKDDLVSVNEAEIVQAREYAKQFGPGTHVMPVGQVSWRDIIANNHAKPTVSLPANEDSQDKTITNANLQLSQDSSLQDNFERQISKSADEESQDKVTPSENQHQIESDKAELFESGFPGGNVDEEAEKKKANVSVVNGLDKAIKSAPLSQKVAQARRNVAKKRRRTISNLSDKARNNAKDEPTIKKRKKLSLDGAVTEKLKKKQEGSKSSLEKEGTSEIKEKRKRTAFSNEKKDILERHFQKSIYATKSMVLEISQEVGLDKKKIDNWFRNRRSKLKKDELDKKLKEAAAAQNKLGNSLSESRNASELDYSSGMSSEETNYEDTPEKTVENNENLEDSGGKNISELAAPEVPVDSETSKGLNAGCVLEKEETPETGQLEKAVQSAASIPTDITPAVVSSATNPSNKEGCGAEVSEEPMDSKQPNSAEKPADDDSVRAEVENSSGSNKPVTPEIPATVSASVDVPDVSLVGKTFYDDSADDCSDDSGEGSLVIAENSDPDSETDEAEDTAPVKMLPKFNFEQIESSEKPLLM